MNDFSDLENKLSELRPVPAREEFLARLEEAMKDVAPEIVPANKIIQPERFRINWAAGFGLAAAAIVLLMVWLNFQPAQNTPKVTSVSPSPAVQPLPNSPSIRDQLIPIGATQVVYHTRDEFYFPGTADQPMRRVRSHTRETLQWRNPVTGASLRVSYPSEQVRLIPVSGQ